MTPHLPAYQSQKSCNIYKQNRGPGIESSFPCYPATCSLFCTVSTVQILLCRPSSSVPAVKSIASIFRLVAFDAPTQQLSPFYLVLYILGLFCALSCISTTCSGNMLFFCPGVIHFFCCPFSSSHNAQFLFHSRPADLCAPISSLWLISILVIATVDPFLCCVYHVFMRLAKDT